MAWYDKLLAFAAPASYRAVEAVNNDNALKSDLAKFQADPTYRVDPTKYDNPEFAIAAQNHLDTLTGKQQVREAAPTANALARFAAEGNGSDVNFPQGEWTQGMMDLGGVKPPAGNPVAQKAITDFMTQGGAERDALLAARGDVGAQARIASRSKDPSVGFKDVSMGVENYGQIRDKGVERTADTELNKFVAEYPLERNVASWNGLVEGLRRIPGISPAKVDSTLKDIAGRNRAPTGAPLTNFVTNGPNSTRSAVNVDMFGEPVATTKTTSSNNPSDREQGLTGSGGDNASLNVSWIGPDGTSQAAVVPRSELPALKSGLEAQGVTEISTVDGKRASRTETLIKPKKKKKKGGILGPRPGGVPAAKPTGGFTYINGKMVAN